MDEAWCGVTGPPRMSKFQEEVGFWKFCLQVSQALDYAGTQ